MPWHWRVIKVILLDGEKAKKKQQHPKIVQAESKLILVATWTMLHRMEEWWVYLCFILFCS